LLIDRLSNIYRRMYHAAMRGGRDPSAVDLVAVSKAVDIRLIKEAFEAGQRVFGESKVQEALKKAERFRDTEIRWHMVGHLQKNKAKAAVSTFDLIHSVDSPELLVAMNKYAAEQGKVQKALIQVNLSGEKSKSGIGETEIGELIRTAEEMDNVKVEGLMTITPFFDDPEEARPFYSRLKSLCNEFGLKESSMGMSGDFEIAIEEGATLVRVGTAIFGERDYS
jgi:pyridoxal phosphate enzyme (YggS family)